MLHVFAGKASRGPEFLELRPRQRREVGDGTMALSRSFPTSALI